MALHDEPVGFALSVPRWLYHAISQFAEVSPNDKLRSGLLCMATQSDASSSSERLVTKLYLCHFGYILRLVGDSPPSKLETSNLKEFLAKKKHKNFIQLLF